MNESFVQAEKALTDLLAIISKGWRIKSDPARERRLRKACEAAIDPDDADQLEGLFIL